ncbi:MAG: JAB domain-containing protein [Sphaerochaetaceae bacterium]|jgi:DNA repair protein RadC|nr:JAB domain-containing protein [Sphaerochaetaceae bacterium]
MKRYRDCTTKGNHIKELPVEQRPREKLQASGPSSLSDLELVTLLIGSGTPRNPATLLAKQVLELLDKTHADEQVQPKEIVRIDGLGIAKATLICAALELGRRRLPTKHKQVIFPCDVYPLIRHYGNRQQEHFICVSLNGAHEIISVNVVSIGLVNHTLVHPRDVLTSHLIQ